MFDIFEVFRKKLASLSVSHPLISLAQDLVILVLLFCQVKLRESHEANPGWSLVLVLLRFFTRVRLLAPSSPRT